MNLLLQALTITQRSFMSKILTQKIINKSINEGRIDKFLVSELKISRNKVLSLIKDLRVQINGE